MGLISESSFPLWYLQNTKQRPPNDFVGAITEHGNCVLIFHSEDLANAFTKSNPIYKVVRVTHDEFTEFLNVLEQRGFNRVASDPTSSGIGTPTSSIEDLRKSMLAGPEERQG